MNNIITIVVLVLLAGCAPNAAIDDNSQLRDKDFTTGCYVVEGVVGFDSYFNTTKGSATMCKLKCSKDIDFLFSYEYENIRTGCKVNVSNMR